MEQAQFWGVNKKLTWTKMWTGTLNSSLLFGEMMSALQQECQAEVEQQNIWDCGLEMIMYDIMLFKLLQAIILQHFEMVL